jgi:uncharacterized membrane protein YfcA
MPPYDTAMPRLVAIGLVAGFLSALFGVGGGIVIVPLLILLARFQPHGAMATSLTAIGITALAGTLAYAFHGEVEPAFAALVGLPAAVGAVAGTALQQRLPGRPLALAFAALLAAIGVSLLVV